MTYDQNPERRDPPPVQREVVHHKSSGAGWWVAGIVAIVAIAGLIFIFGAGGADEGDLELARETGRAEAVIANAADSAQQAAAEAAESSAAAADAIAENTEAAAENTAAAVDNAADEAAERTGM